MVVSRSSTARSMRCCTSGWPASLVAACSCSPVANSRWMTTSCRSRAMRSRSLQRRPASPAPPARGPVPGPAPPARRRCHHRQFAALGVGTLAGRYATTSTPSATPPTASGTSRPCRSSSGTGQCAAVPRSVDHRRAAAGEHRRRTRCPPPAIDQPADVRSSAARHLDGERRRVARRRAGPATRSAPATSRARVATSSSASVRRTSPSSSVGDLGGGLSQRCRRSRLRVQAGVVDGHAGRGGQRDDELLVVLGELCRRRASRPGTGCRTPGRGCGSARRGSCASAGGWAGTRTTGGAG